MFEVAAGKIFGGGRSFSISRNRRRLRGGRSSRSQNEAGDVAAGLAAFSTAEFVKCIGGHWSKFLGVLSLQYSVSVVRENHQQQRARSGQITTSRATDQLRSFASLRMTPHLQGDAPLAERRSSETWNSIRAAGRWRNKKPLRAKVLGGSQKIFWETRKAL